MRAIVRLMSTKALLAMRSNDGFGWRGMSASHATLPDMAKYDRKQVSDMFGDMCIAIDQTDRIIKGIPKVECHLMSLPNNNGVLHRGFSVLLFNSVGEILLTQRSDTKITYPGVFTNTFCSHPLYTELEMDETDAIGVKRAVQRRIKIELGVDPKQVPIQDIHWMTRIKYIEPSCDSWGEHELGYIMIIQKDVTLNPDPNEVKSYQYVSKDNFLPFLREQESKGNHTTPWFRFMIDRYLFDWWNNLRDLRTFQDHNTIHHCLR